MGASRPALGAAVIGDIFKLEERGRAMGVFFAVSKLLSIDSDVFALFRFIRPACLEQLSLLLLEVHSCFRLHQAYIDNESMIVQVGLLITGHGERCTAS